LQGFNLANICGYLILYNWKCRTKSANIESTGKIYYEPKKKEPSLWILLVDSMFDAFCDTFSCMGWFSTPMHRLFVYILILKNLLLWYPGLNWFSIATNKFWFIILYILNGVFLFSRNHFACGLYMPPCCLFSKHAPGQNRTHTYNDTTCTCIQANTHTGRHIQTSQNTHTQPHKRIVRAFTHTPCGALPLI